ICYRGILMPFTSDGDTIDFIYGVINWKAAESHAETVIVSALASDELDLDEPPLELNDDYVVQPARRDEPHLVWDDGPLSGAEANDEDEVPDATLAQDAGLADRLSAARATAEVVKSADHRSRAALYRALSQAYDFAVAAGRDPDDYAELLEDSGVRAQARAPMTPIVKLVFGIDYDKTRLTEFASALSYAQRQGVAPGGFEALVDRQPGGLKGLVAAERQARRPEPKANNAGDAARDRLRCARPLALETLPADEEFCLVLTRRGADGTHQPVAQIADQALVERAIRRTA
ncbi:MAG: hypothetical protein ABIW03_01935, partial [Sphingomicrobium sp.]